MQRRRYRSSCRLPFGRVRGAVPASGPRTRGGAGRASRGTPPPLACATCRQSNSPSARERAISLIAWRSPGAASSLRTASAPALGAWGSTSRPVTPSSTTSPSPPVAAATIGRPQAIASRATADGQARARAGRPRRQPSGSGPAVGLGHGPHDARPGRSTSSACVRCPQPRHVRSPGRGPLPEGPPRAPARSRAAGRQHPDARRRTSLGCQSRPGTAAGGAGRPAAPSARRAGSGWCPRRGAPTATRSGGVPRSISAEHLGPGTRR